MSWKTQRVENLAQEMGGLSKSLDSFFNGTPSRRCLECLGTIPRSGSDVRENDFRGRHALQRFYPTQERPLFVPIPSRTMSTGARDQLVSICRPDPQGVSQQIGFANALPSSTAPMGTIPNLTAHIWTDAEIASVRRYLSTLKGIKDVIGLWAAYTRPKPCGVALPQSWKEMEDDFKVGCGHPTYTAWRRNRGAGGGHHTMDHRKNVLAEISRRLKESIGTEADVVKLVDEEVRTNYSGSIPKYNVFLKGQQRRNNI